MHSHDLQRKSGDNHTVHRKNRKEGRIKKRKTTGSSKETQICLPSLD